MARVEIIECRCGFSGNSGLFSPRCPACKALGGEVSRRWERKNEPPRNRGAAALANDTGQVAPQSAERG